MATAIVAIIFTVAKFSLGAWVVVIVIPILVAAMRFIAHEYKRAELELHVRPESVIPAPGRRQRVYVPFPAMRRDVVRALRFARTMSDHVTAVHVTDDVEAGERLRERFERQIPDVEFVIVESPYRALIAPLSHYLRMVAAENPEAITVVLLPEYVYRHWWERFLYNQNAHRIRAALLGQPNILVANAPYRAEA